MMGTTTVTSYVESGAGVKAGGKTGMTSLVIGLLFLACIFFAPLATSLPKQIDGAALLFVSVLFIRNITDIEWNDIGESAPAILAMISMPLTYSISNGIALAFVSYALIKIFTGKFSNTSPQVIASVNFSGKTLDIFINVKPTSAVTSSRTAIKINLFLVCATP